ncbi:hypothetical protein CVT26_007161 [Gymnopilus dilepis]|uniref:Uncharacterized protein n=1 Tax=Gymnopilus dilepis TaxID=231916 RepID=A0A409W0C1_9AGAR|nr:hypothetical protein CVT26_007161 [Gymnopilus dilepis]
MPGANYMGGKRSVQSSGKSSSCALTHILHRGRNAMKARAKDAVGRIQKGFFGRQKLDMLYQGLSSSAKTKPTITSSTKAQKGVLGPTNTRLNTNSAAAKPEIDLAHARKKVIVDANAHTRSFIPSPIRVAPSTPRSRQRLKVHTSSSSSALSKGQNSKALLALDTLERQFVL